MRSSHSIRAALTALGVAVPLVLSAQPPPVPALQEAGATSFTISARGAIGSEQIALSRTATGWTIVSSGRLGAPIDVVARRLQVRYTADWRPIEFTLDGTVRGQAQTIRTTVEGTAAKSHTVVAGQATENPTPSTRPRCCCCRTASSAPRSARRAVEDDGGRRRRPGTSCPRGRSTSASASPRRNRSRPRRAWSARSAPASRWSSLARSSRPTSGPTMPGG